MRSRRESGNFWSIYQYDWRMTEENLRKRITDDLSIHVYMDDWGSLRIRTMTHLWSVIYDLYRYACTWWECVMNKWRMSDLAIDDLTWRMTDCEWLENARDMSIWMVRLIDLSTRESLRIYLSSIYTSTEWLNESMDVWQWLRNVWYVMNPEIDLSTRESWESMYMSWMAVCLMNEWLRNDWRIWWIYRYVYMSIYVMRMMRKRIFWTYLRVHVHWITLYIYVYVWANPRRLTIRLNVCMM